MIILDIPKVEEEPEYDVWSLYFPQPDEIRHQNNMGKWGNIRGGNPNVS
jgi:hypothetical protein